jgi:hypothetical protein
MGSAVHAEPRPGQNSRTGSEKLRAGAMEMEDHWRRAMHSQEASRQKDVG